MLTDVQALVGSVALTFLMVMTASLLRARAWTPAGLAMAFGNREQMPDAPAFVGRADRAAKNMLEGMILFVALACAARFANSGAEAGMGATVFFYARVVYWFVYLAGIPYLRTAVWSVGIAGLALLARAALS